MSTAKVVALNEPSNDVGAAYERLRRAYRAEPYPSAEVREDRLDRLVRVLQRERDAIVDAISQDFGNRSPVESLAVDVLVTVEAARDARQHLRQWMKRRHADVQWWTLPGRAWVEPQPLGVVAIIAPWNYPVNLLLSPLAGALAAGNRALLKPSELAPRTAELVQRLMRETFTPEEVAVVTGGPEVARALTALKVDHLVFTGSTAVGKLVARAAADNLVPITLELGGKSPALLHPEYSVETFAKKVAEGKVWNAGQTCIAPDYVLVPAGSEARFGEAFKAAVRKAVPDLSAPTVTSVASERGWLRFTALLDDARAKGARVEETVSGAVPAERRTAPVLVFGVQDSMRVMQEELFCPILPVVAYQTLDEALAYINARPRPLALYYFDHDEARVDRVLRETVSGNVTINETMYHALQDQLPFGGVGDSGIGRYHGHAGFEALSHLKGVFEQSRFSAVPHLLASPLSMASRVLHALIRGRRRKAGE